MPLRAAIYAQGSDEPVLEVKATDISYGKIAASQIDATPPAGAKVTEIDPPSGVDKTGKPTHVEGVEEVAQRLDFPLAAPDELAGLPRRSVRLVRMGSESGAVSVYGRGLGAILVFQTKAGPAGKSRLAGIPFCSRTVRSTISEMATQRSSPTAAATRSR